MVWSVERVASRNAFHFFSSAYRGQIFPVYIHDRLRRQPAVRVGAGENALMIKDCDHELSTPETPQGGVSVVLVTYRTGEPLFLAIEALLSQEEVGQLIVVDNGNPPDVIDVLRQLAGEDERVSLLTGHGNIGFGKACNLGSEKATGEMLMLLNPDCVMPKDGVRTLLHEGQTSSERGLIGGRLVDGDGVEQTGSRREILTPWLAFVEIFSLYRLFPKHPSFRRFNRHDQAVPEKTTEVPVISGACMLMPLKEYRAIGGMDEDFFLHVEDIDFCLRFQRNGGKVFFCPQVEITHHKSSSDASTVFVEWHKTKGFWTYFRKNFKGLYPPGFLGLVNFGILCRFAVVACKSFLARAF